MQFYTKETVDRWKYDLTIPLADYLEKNKFYTDGWFKNKILDAILWISRKIDLKIDLIKAHDEVRLYKHSINSDDLLDMIYQHKVDMNVVWQEQPRYLILGQKQWQKLTGVTLHNFACVDYEVCLKRMVNYQDRFDAIFNNNNKRRFETKTLFWGFKILVTPWIDGCFLLPDIT